MRNDDERLVSGMLNGDSQAFFTFYFRYSGALQVFVERRARLNADDAQDVVQCTLIKAMRGLQGFRGEAGLFSWLCQICRNEIANHQRSAARRSHEESFDSCEPARRAALQVPTGLEPEECLNRDDCMDAVRSTLGTLPERYVAALELKYGEGCSVREVAAQLGVSWMAAQSVLKRAREAFRAGWEVDARP